MRSYVELFDLRSGNVVASYGDESEAWETLRRAALEFGLEEIDGYALSRVDGDQETLIAMEAELVRRVAHQMSQDPVASGSRR